MFVRKLSQGPHAHAHFLLRARAPGREDFMRLLRGAVNGAPLKKAPRLYSCERGDILPVLEFARERQICLRSGVKEPRGFERGPSTTWLFRYLGPFVDRRRAEAAFYDCYIAPWPVFPKNIGFSPPLPSLCLYGSIFRGLLLF